MTSHPADNTPADVVRGTDPRFTLTDVALPGKQCTCTYTAPAEQMEQHIRIAHPASRNPEVTCQERAPWDHERWCVRPKGHPADQGGTGGHWTPTFHGGGKFW